MPFKDEIDKLIKEGKVGQAMKLESKRQLQAMGRTGGAPNIMSLMGVLARARKNAPDKPDKDEPEKEDPPLPPLVDNGVDYASGRPKSNSWSDIVAFNFPKGAGKQYKDGGLVRGGGCAAKGRGRGRIV